MEQAEFERELDERWNSDKIPVSKPQKLEGDFPADLFEGPDVLERLATNYQMAAIELMRRTRCELLPVVYLHLQRDPFDWDKVGPGLYQMQILESDTHPLVVQSTFEMLVRIVATRGQALGTALCMRVTALIPNLQQRVAELVTVRCETKDAVATWCAPFEECEEHGLHTGEFRRTDKIMPGNFGPLMKPWDGKAAGNPFARDSRDVAVRELAKSMGFDELLGKDGLERVVSEVLKTPQTFESYEQAKEKLRGY